MNKKYEYDYPMMSATVDIIVYDSKSDTIALIKRRNEPFKDYFALPGGYIEFNETAVNAAVRELSEECNILIPSYKFKQIHTMTSPKRDPRGRVISIVYYVDLSTTDYTMDKLKAGDDAKDVQIIPYKEAILMNLAFDHRYALYIFSEKVV